MSCETNTEFCVWYKTVLRLRKIADPIEKEKNNTLKNQ